MKPRALDDKQILMLRWHERLRNLGWKNLKMLAKIRVLPSVLIKVVEYPLCVSCLFSTARMRAWRHKGQMGENAPSIDAEEKPEPGLKVSADQIVCA